jgi:hypothetical protein
LSAPLAVSCCYLHGLLPIDIIAIPAWSSLFSSRLPEAEGQPSLRHGASFRDTVNNGSHIAVIVFRRFIRRMNITKIAAAGILFCAIYEHFHRRHASAATPFPDSATLSVIAFIIALIYPTIGLAIITV